MTDAPAFPHPTEGRHLHYPGLSRRDWFKGQILAGFCANPAIFAPRPDCGWSLVNCTEASLMTYAGLLADEALAEQASQND